jgi:hypothetical protein
MKNVFFWDVASFDLVRNKVSVERVVYLQGGKNPLVRNNVSSSWQSASYC